MLSQPPHPARARYRTRSRACADCVNLSAVLATLCHEGRGKERMPQDCFCSRCPQFGFLGRRRRGVGRGVQSMISKRPSWCSTTAVQLSTQSPQLM